MLSFSYSQEEKDYRTSLEYQPEPMNVFFISIFLSNGSFDLGAFFNKLRQAFTTRYNCCFDQEIQPCAGCVGTEEAAS